MKGEPIMKRVYGSSLVIGLVMAALVSGIAYGDGPGHGHGHGSLVPWIVHRMITPEQMHSAVAAEKTNLKTLYSQVHSARQQLTQDLVAGKDTSNDVQALQTAQNNLLAEKVKLAQNILSNLSTAQRSQVSQFLTQWSSMKQSQRQQTAQLLQQFGSSQQGNQDTP